MGNDMIRGVIVPIMTPFTPDEKVDTSSLRRLVNYLIDNGVHGIWAAGTTGEFATQPDDQRLVAIETVVDEVGGRVPVHRQRVGYQHPACRRPCAVGPGVGPPGHRRHTALLLPLRSGRASRALPIYQGAGGAAPLGVQHTCHRQDRRRAGDHRAARKRGHRRRGQG